MAKTTQSITELYDLSAIQKQIDTVKAGVKGINDYLLEMAKNGSKAFAGSDNVSTVKQVNEETKKQDEIQKELTEVQKKQVAASLQLQSLKKQEKDAIQAQTSAYKELSNRYGEAAQKAKDLAAAYGVNSEKAKESAKEAKALNEQLKAIDSSIGNNQRNVGNYTSAFGKFEGALTSVKGAVMGIAGAIGITAGLSSLKDFFQDGIKSAIDYEQRSNKLSFALNNNGDAVKRMTAYAAELSKESLFKKSDIMDAEVFALSLGRTEEEAKKMISAAMGLSRVTGNDLNTSMTMLNGTFGGTLRGINRFVPDVQTLSKEQLKAGVAIDLVNEKLGRFGKEGLDTTEGKLITAEKVWGGLKRTIGEGFLGIIGSVAEGIAAVGKGLGIMAETKLSDKLQEESLQANNLALSLTNTNLRSDERLVIMDKLKKLSPDIIKGLDAENMDYSKLWVNIRKYNDEVANKIIIAQEDEKIAKANKELADARMKMIKSETEAMQRMNSEVKAMIPYNAHAAGQLKAIMTDTSISVEDRTKKFGDVLAKYNTGSAQFFRAFTTNKDAYVKAEKEAQQVAEDTGKKKVELLKMLGIDEQSYKQKEIDSQKELEAETIKNRESSIEGEKGAAKEGKKISDDKVKLLEKERKTEEELLKTSEMKLKNDLDWYKSVGNAQLIFEAEAKIIQNESLKQINQATKAKNEGIMSEQAYADRITEIRAEADNKTSDAFRRKVERDQKLAEKTVTKNPINPLTGTPYSDEEWAMVQSDEAERDTFNKKIADKETAVIEDSVKREENAEARKRKIKQRLMNLESTALDAVLEMEKRASEQQLKKLEASYSAQQDALKQKYDNGLMTQDEYNKQSAALEKQRAEQERQVNHDAFETERAGKIAKAVIAGVLAAVELLAEEGWVGAALATAAAAIDVAMIASEPNPYKTGTDSAKKGPAVVAEDGKAEIVRFNSGKSMLFTEPTYIMMQGGEKVIPNNRIDFSQYGAGKTNTTSFTVDNSDVIRAIKSKPETIVNITEKGISKIVTESGKVTKFVQKQYSL